MKSMKNLLVAMAGLAGFGLAGSALAACDNTNLSAWSGKITNKGTLNVVVGGLEAVPSACKLQSTLTSNDPAATAAVFYNDPTAESSYHFRFYFNQDSIGVLSGFHAGQIFAAGSPNVFPATGLYSYSFAFQLGLIPGSGGKNALVAAVGCNDAGQQYVCLSNPVLLNAGNHYVEGYYNTGSGTGGFLKIWVDHDATLASQPAPDTSITNIDDSEWGGVNFVALGLGAAASGFTLNQPFSVDAFDSRRQTFIGP